MRALPLIVVIATFLIGLVRAEPVKISLAPVIDAGVLSGAEDCISLRSATIAELTEAYDCVVLARTNGAALREEQRLLALESLDPETFPYLPAADYVVVLDVAKSGQGVRLRLTYTSITGREDGDVLSANVEFDSVEDLLERGPDAASAKLAEALALGPRQASPASQAMFQDKVWAVLPWLDYSSSNPGQDELSASLTEEAAQVLERVLPEVERMASEAVAGSQLAYYAGATERQAAAVGQEIGADYLLAGSVQESGQGRTLYAFVVRSRDAVVLAGREMMLRDGDPMEANFALLLEDLLRGLPQIDPLPESTAAANEEEAKLLYDIAEHVNYSMYGWRNYQALELFLAAWMVAQDTHLETPVLARVPIVMSYHPNTYYFRSDWETATHDLERRTFNEHVIAVLERAMPQPRSPDELSVLFDAYEEQGEWERALELHGKLVELNELDPRSSERKAASYLRLLSLTGQFDEAAAFYEGLSKNARGNFSYAQAAINYRRMGDDGKELATLTEMLETGSWSTTWDYWRMCHLLEKYATAEDQHRLLLLFDKHILRKPLVQWRLIQAELALGQPEEAAARAQLLLARETLGKTGFESEDAFRAALLEVAGEEAPAWPKAVSIQPIPPEYKMYIQPVGDYDAELLAQAIDITRDFFGCDIVIRPTLAPPPGRTAYHSELTQYDAVPMLRSLTTVRPIPKDAIAQLYYVDRKFLVYGRGPADDVYRRGLGTMVTPASVLRISSDPDLLPQQVAGMLIRHFRYYIERSQGISFEESPDNRPCVNSVVSLREAPRFGYCPVCVKNYAAADMQAVYAFAQVNPLPEVFTDAYTARPRISDQEKADIEAYVQLVGIK